MNCPKICFRYYTYSRSGIHAPEPVGPRSSWYGAWIPAAGDAFLAKIVRIGTKNTTFVFIKRSYDQIINKNVKKDGKGAKSSILTTMYILISSGRILPIVIMS